VLLLLGWKVEERAQHPFADDRLGQRVAQCDDDVQDLRCEIE
jgi:hypothetical protein